MKRHNIAQKPHKKYTVSEGLLAAVTCIYLFFDLYIQCSQSCNRKEIKLKDHHHPILLVVKRFFKTQREDMFVFTLRVQVPSIKAP